MKLAENQLRRITNLPARRARVLFLLLPAFFLFLLPSCSKDDDLDHNFIHAATKGQIEEVKFLLQKGADINARVEPGGHSALMLAAGNGQQEIVKFLLENGAKVNLQGNLKETALTLAAANGQKEIVEMLLTSGADFRASDTGLTPLMMAVAGGHSQVAELLLSKGENVNAKQFDGWTVLMHATVRSDPETIMILLAKGADPTPKNKEGKTAMDIAEEFNHKDTADLLRNSNQPAK